MTLTLTFRKLAKSEEGAVTVDWVVLSAAIVGLSVAAVATVRTSSDLLAEDISNNVATQTVGLTTEDATQN